MSNTIYFDQSSTSFPKAPGVARAVYEILNSGSFNINRGGYAASYDLSETVLYTREKLCALFNWDKSGQVVFTPGVTYSLNYIIMGLLLPGDHIIVSEAEHNAVLRPVAYAESLGVSVSYVGCDEYGEVHADDVAELLRANTKAVFVLHASNVTGTVNDIESIGRVCHTHGVFFVCDTAQTAGILPIDMKNMHIDALCFTGHKALLAPQGIGGFLVSTALASAMSPIIRGGTGSYSDSADMPDVLPDKFEAGTMNIPGIIGLNTALSYIEARGIDDILRHELALTSQFIDGVRTIRGAKIIGRQDTKKRTPTVSVDFLGHDNAEISYALDRDFGIMTRCGMHCAPRAHKSAGTFPQGTVRFSFGHENTEKEVSLCLSALKKITDGAL